MKYHMIWPEDRWIDEEELIQKAIDDLDNLDIVKASSIITVQEAISVAHDLGTATFTNERRPE